MPRAAGTIGLALALGWVPPVVVPADARQAPPPAAPVSRLEGTAGPGAVLPAPEPPQVPRTGDLPPVPVTRLDVRSHAAELDGPRTLSLTVAEPLPLREVLARVARDTPFSVVVDDGVGGTFAGELKNLTLRQALEAVLFPQRLDYDLRGNVVRVFQSRVRTRIFELDYLNVRRTSERRAGDPSAPTASASLTSASGGDLFEQVAASVAAILSPSGRCHVDPVSGLVQVTDYADRLDRVAVYLDAVHLRATRQVRLLAHVLEITFASPGAAGIDWAAVAARAGAGAPDAASGRIAGMRVKSPQAAIAALAEQGSVRLIASPQTLAMNNEPAVIRIGTDDVFVGEGGSSTAVVSEGLTLTVVPQIASDGIVQLGVSPAFTRKAGEAATQRGTPVRSLEISEVDSVMRVRDGDTVVISGLLRDRQEADSARGSGGASGAGARRTVRSELVVMLTPTVVTAAGGSTEPAR